MLSGVLKGHKSFKYDFYHLTLLSEKLLKNMLDSLLKYKTELQNSKFVISRECSKFFYNLHRKLSDIIIMAEDILDIQYKYFSKKRFERTFERCLTSITYEENFLFMLFSMLFVLCSIVFIHTEFVSLLLLFVWWRNKIS